MVVIQPLFHFKPRFSIIYSKNTPVLEGKTSTLLFSSTSLHFFASFPLGIVTYDRELLIDDDGLKDALEMRVMLPSSMLSVV